MRRSRRTVSRMNKRRRTNRRRYTTGGARF